MADAPATGGVGTVATTPNTATDAARAQPMPAVPPNVERMRPSEFIQARREGKLGPQAPQQPPTRSERLGEVARALEGRDTPPSEKAPEQAPQEPPAEGEQATVAEPEAPTEAAAPDDAALFEALRKAKTEGVFDPVLADGMLHEVNADGQLRYVDYNELVSSYQRQAPINRRLKEVTQREQVIQRERQSMKEHFEAIRDPAQFDEIYSRNGYDEQLDQLAEIRVARKAESKALIIAAGVRAARQVGYTQEQIDAGAADRDHRVIGAMKAADEQQKRARALEIENRRLAHEAQQARAAIESQKHEQETAHWHETFSRQLGQLRPGSLAAHGIKDTEQVRVAFLRHLQEVIQTTPLGPDGITRQHTMLAARSLKEEQEDQQAREGGGHLSPAEWKAQQAAEARRRQLPANRMGTGAGRPVGSGQPERLRPSDLAAARRNGKLGQ